MGVKSPVDSWWTSLLSFFSFTGFQSSFSCRTSQPQCPHQKHPASTEQQLGGGSCSGWRVTWKQHPKSDQKYPLVICYNLRLKMAIEIVIFYDFFPLKIAIFYVAAYKRVPGCHGMLWPKILPFWVTVTDRIDVQLRHRAHTGHPHIFTLEISLGNCREPQHRRSADWLSIRWCPILSQVGL